MSNKEATPSDNTHPAPATAPVPAEAKPEISDNPPSATSQLPVAIVASVHVSELTCIIEDPDTDPDETSLKERLKPVELHVILPTAQLPAASDSQLSGKANHCNICDLPSQCHGSYRKYHECHSKVHYSCSFLPS